MIRFDRTSKYMIFVNHTLACHQCRFGCCQNQFPFPKFTNSRQTPPAIQNLNHYTENSNAHLQIFGGKVKKKYKYPPASGKLATVRVWPRHEDEDEETGGWGESEIPSCAAHFKKLVKLACCCSSMALCCSTMVRWFSGEGNDMERQADPYSFYTVSQLSGTKMQ